MFIILVLASVTSFLFIYFDLLPIFHQKNWKVFWLYSIILFFAYLIVILYLLEIKVPSPAKPLKKLVFFIFGLQD